MTGHKRLFILILIGVLYFSGVAMVLYPMIGNIYSLYHSRADINEYQQTVNNLTDEEIQKMLESAKKYNELLAKGNVDKTLSRSLNSKSDIMCYVEIPSLNIYLPVFYGTNEDVLLRGCGWLENTSLPIGGTDSHCVISGHTGLPNAEMFTKLDQMAEGDMFYIRVLDTVLAYRVDNIESVNPDRVDLLAIVEGKDYVTLLTCTPYGINDKRLLVRGERVEYKAPETSSVVEESKKQDISTDKEEEKKEDKKEISDVSKPADKSTADDGLSDQIKQQVTVVCIIAGVSIVVFVAAFIWLIKTTGKKDQLTDDDSNAEDDNAEKEK